MMPVLSNASSNTAAGRPKAGCRSEPARSELPQALQRAASASARRALLTLPKTGDAVGASGEVRGPKHAHLPMPVLKRAAIVDSGAVTASR